MVYHSIQEYVEAKLKWEQTPATILPRGEMVIKANGAYVSLKEYVANNSVPVYQPPVRCSADGTAIPGGAGVIVYKKGSRP